MSWYRLSGSPAVITTEIAHLPKRCDRGEAISTGAAA
jgi:hypothetical protein